MPIRFCSAASLREGAGLSVRQRFLLVLISAVVIKSITPPTFLESFRFVVNLLLLLHHPLSCFCFRRNGMSKLSPPEAFGLAVRLPLLLHYPPGYFCFLENGMSRSRHDLRQCLSTNARSPSPPGILHF